ncbi:hypothetical protein LINPERHAP1_LOCUS16526, partial [Linum perenne]
MLPLGAAGGDGGACGNPPHQIRNFNRPLGDDSRRGEQHSGEMRPRAAVRRRWSETRVRGADEEDWESIRGIQRRRLDAV